MTNEERTALVERLRVFEGIYDRMAPSLEREKHLRAALDALGFEIREKANDTQMRT